MQKEDRCKKVGNSAFYISVEKFVKSHLQNEKSVVI